MNPAKDGWRLNKEKHFEMPKPSKKRWQFSNPIPSIQTALIWIESSNTVITPQPNPIDMSQITNVSDTGTTQLLIAPTLAMLNGLDAAGDLLSMALHDCAEVADISAENKVWESKAQFPQGVNFRFEGVLFLKGLVAVFTEAAPNAAFTANIEWE